MNYFLLVLDAIIEKFVGKPKQDDVFDYGPIHRKASKRSKNSKRLLIDVAIDLLAERGELGITSSELAEIIAANGTYKKTSASPALHDLHKNNRIARLTTFRNNCHVYVLRKHIAGRRTSAPRVQRASKMARAEA